MDSILNFMDQFTQSELWRNTLSHFQWIDWVAVISVALGVFYGVKKGFLGVLGDIIQLILVIAVTLQFNPQITKGFQDYFGFLPTYAIPLLGFIASALIFWLAIGFIFGHLKKFVPAHTSSPLRFLGGAVAGGAYLFVFLSFVSQGILLAPWESLHRAYGKGVSYTGYTLSQMAPNIHQLVMHPSKFFSTKRL